MNGKLWVESVPQKGSTFHFTSHFQAIEATKPPQVENNGAASLRGLRLLIIDDNATTCRILTQHACRWGMVHRHTQQPQQALEWLQKGEVFDVAIIDTQMPDTNVMALTEAIRKLPTRQTLPLLLLTSLMGNKEAHSGLATLPQSASVAKPIKPAQLLQTMLHLMSGVKPSTKAVAGSGKLDPSMAQRFPLRVLLCDDNVINQKVASRLMQQMGYRPDVVANGLEALAALEKEPYNLIFMDVMMPEMNGLEATEAIRQRQKDPKAFPHYKAPLIIVAMTASAMQGDRERCLSAGMDDYIAKPVRPEDVRKTIETWAPKALQPSVPVPLAEPTAQPQDAPAADPTTPAPETGPVDIDRLLEFTDGSPENLRELVDLYLTQTTEQLEKLRAALAAADPAEVRRVAHSCAGASATCGMRHMVPLLRELERQGREGKLTDAGGIFEQTAREFQKVRSYLESRQVGQGDVAATN